MIHVNFFFLFNFSKSINVFVNLEKPSRKILKVKILKLSTRIIKVVHYNKKGKKLSVLRQ